MCLGTGSCTYSSTADECLVLAETEFYEILSCALGVLYHVFDMYIFAVHAAIDINYWGI